MRILFTVIFCFTTALFMNGNNDKDKTHNRVVTGRVETPAGEPVAGASLCITETGETVYAGLDGRYKLVLPAGSDYTIKINSLGFKPLSLKSSRLATFTDLHLTEF